MCVLMFKSSHGPDGKIADALASTLAYTTAADAPVNYRLMYVLRDSKFPIPKGKLLTCLPRLTLAQLRTLRSTTGGTCYSDLAKFPSPRW